MIIGGIGIGGLEDMVHDLIDWESQHIREVPRFLRDRWLRSISFIMDEVRDPPNTKGRGNFQALGRSLQRLLAQGVE